MLHGRFFVYFQKLVNRQKYMIEMEPVISMLHAHPIFHFVYSLILLVDKMSGSNRKLPIFGYHERKSPAPAWCRFLLYRRQPADRLKTKRTPAGGYGGGSFGAILQGKAVEQ